jgi:hypothetical protein
MSNNNKEYWISVLKYMIRHKKNKKHNEQHLLFKRWSRTYPTKSQTKKYIDAFSDHV